MFQFGTGYKYKIQKSQKLKKKKKKKKNIDEYIIDETVVKADSELIWLWIAIIEPKYREILSINISKNKKYVYSSSRTFSIGRCK